MDTEGGWEPAAGEAAAAAAAVVPAGGGDDCSAALFALDEVAVCLHVARSLLQAQPDWELAEFEAAWQRAVPEVG